MTTDVDARGRDAARAARDAVGPVVDAMLSRRVVRRRRDRAVTLAGVGTVAALVLLLAVVALREGATTVSVGPASPGSATSVPPRPDPPGLPPLPTGDAPLAEGRSSDGRRWWLTVGGPSADLCLSAEVSPTERDRSGAATAVLRPTTCAGGPLAGPDPDRYRPRRHGDVRVPNLVFGRLPDDVAVVTVELGEGAATTPTPVLQREGGPYYVVELPPAARPVAAVGHRTDGTTVRERFR